MIGALVPLWTGFVFGLPISALFTTFGYGDARPVVRPGEPLRRDVIASARSPSRRCAWRVARWPIMWVLAVDVLVPFVLSRAWVRFALVVLAFRVRGILPLRLPAFLAWAHRAGLLRITGKAYQFRHIELQRRLVEQRTAQHAS